MSEGLGGPDEGPQEPDTSGNTSSDSAPSGSAPSGSASSDSVPSQGAAPGSAFPAGGSAENSGADGAAPSGGGDEPLAAEEEALRRLLQDSVRDLEPSEDSLDHLHRAVPARRTHRRQALVGAVAAALIAVVGIPTLLYGGVVPGIGDDKHPLTASSSQGQTHGSDGGEGSEGSDADDKAGKNGKGDDGDKGGKGKDTAEPSPTDGPGDGSADPDESLPANAPTCGRDQLGQGTAQAGAPDGQGTVYGSFRVTNTSGDACTVEGEGMVGADVQGSSARARVAIMDHTPGDPAPGLGDPAAASDELVLSPGASYIVKFAWVPNDSSGCPGDSPPPTTDQSNGDNDNPGTGADTGGDDGGSGDPGGPGTTPGEGNGGAGGDPGDGGEEPSVVVSHTPEVGSPAAAGTKLDGACGGTVYRTGVLPAS